jgi:transcriptional regulator with XRE-family HTH domain
MQVPRTYISKIENGKAIPTLGSLERLAEALEVDMRSDAAASRLFASHLALWVGAGHGDRPAAHRLTA